MVEHNWIPSKKSATGPPSAKSVAERPDRVPTYTMCCIVDEHPRFFVELVLWAICARKYLPSDAFRLVVYTIGNVPSDLTKWLESLGISVQSTVNVVEGSPHCNKIRPFLEAQTTEFVAVCDTDLFFVKDPTNILGSKRYRAAPNNHCNPPPQVFEVLLSASGPNRPYRPGISLFKGGDGRRETHINNISAGIVVAPTSRADELAQKWRKWALWLVKNRDMLGAWGGHVDQVAFALALEELREDVEFLPPQINTILHLFEEISTCVAVHLTTGHIPNFPHRFNSDRTLKTDGLSESMVSSLARLNACILEATQKIAQLASTREHYDKFLNPLWLR